MPPSGPPSSELLERRPGVTASEAAKCPDRPGRARRGGLRVSRWPGGYRLVGAPGEVDPAVGAAPDVLAVDDRPGLLVEHRTANLADLAGAEVLHQLERQP